MWCHGRLITWKDFRRCLFFVIKFVVNEESSSNGKLWFFSVALDIGTCSVLNRNSRNVMSVNIVLIYYEESPSINSYRHLRHIWKILSLNRFGCQWLPGISPQSRYVIVICVWSEKNLSSYKICLSEISVVVEWKYHSYDRADSCEKESRLLWNSPRGNFSAKAIFHVVQFFFRQVFQKLHCIVIESSTWNFCEMLWTQGFHIFLMKFFRFVMKRIEYHSNEITRPIYTIRFINWHGISYAFVFLYIRIPSYFVTTRGSMIRELFISVNLNLKI